jgi:hypothetical protein
MSQLLRRKGLEEPGRSIGEFHSFSSSKAVTFTFDLTAKLGPLDADEA